MVQEIKIAKIPVLLPKGWFFVDELTTNETLQYYVNLGIISDVLMLQSYNGKLYRVCAALYDPEVDEN